MVFCWCPAGKFKMGLGNKKKVDVGISNGFWMSKYELTKGIRNRTGSQAYANTQTKHANMPWATAPGSIKFFLDSFVQIEQKKGHLPRGWTYRLPTEAEWEYACRAGSQSKYSFGDSASDLYLYANYADAKLFKDDTNYYYSDLKHNDGVGKELSPVGCYRPNAWGIHDMHGNLSEYVKGGKRLAAVHRGGAWCSTSEYCLSGFRNTTGSQSNILAFTGTRFVLAKTIVKVEKKSKKLDRKKRKKRKVKK